MVPGLVMYWNEKAAEILNIHTNPGDDTRRFALFHIAIHDALNSIVQSYARYALESEIDPSVSHEAAINTAAADMLSWAVGDIVAYGRTLKNEGLKVPFTDNLDVWQTEKLKNISDWNKEKMALLKNDLMKKKGRSLGLNSAVAILKKRLNIEDRKNVNLLSFDPKDMEDGGDTKFGTFQTDYYKNTLRDPKKNKFLTNWSTIMQPIATNAHDQFVIPPPPELTTPRYIDEYNFTKNNGGKNSPKSGRENEQIGIWSDIRQHIIWNKFARKVVEYHYTNPFISIVRMNSEWEVARLFALIHTAMADGAGAMFNVLYKFNRWRPVTAIKFQDNPTPKWEPLLETPRVPEYPSSFGILGAATGTVLEKLLGPKIEVDMDNDPPINSLYVSLHYKNITQAVDENALTAILCGRNFHSSLEAGKDLGIKIGGYVFDNKFRKV